MKNKLFERLPKKYHNRVEDFELEDGLIDGCPYMLYFKAGWTLCGESSVPCKSIAEAIRYIKEA